MIDLSELSWRASVLKCVHDLKRQSFFVQDMYSNYELSLARRFPLNTRIQAGIRRELQHLRDDGYLAHGPERGEWLFLKALLPEMGGFDANKFIIREGPLPNYPLSELRETQASFEHSKSRDYEADKYLGSLGEKVVIHHEKNSLEIAGQKGLARKVEQVSATKGDHLGYDILSYHADGTEKWIEVKTTKKAISTRFYISENQINVSENFPNNYWLYRLYEFNFETHLSSMYCVSGSLRNKLNLRPEKYSALPI